MGELVDLFAQGLQIGQRQAVAEGRQEFVDLQVKQAQQELARMRQAASPEVAQAFIDVHDINKTAEELRGAWALLFPHKQILALAGSGRDTLLKQQMQINKEIRQQDLKIKLIQEEQRIKDEFGDENALAKYERDTFNYQETVDQYLARGASDEFLEGTLGRIPEERREGFRSTTEDINKAFQPGAKALSRKNFRLELTALAKRASRAAKAKALKDNEKGQPYKDGDRQRAFDAALIQFQAENQDVPFNQLDMTEFADLLVAKGYFDKVKKETADEWYDLIAGGVEGLPDEDGADRDSTPLAPAKTADQIIQENFPDLKEFGRDAAIEQLTALLKEGDKNELGEPTGKVFTDEAKARMIAFVDQAIPEDSTQAVGGQVVGDQSQGRPFEPKGPPAPEGTKPPRSPGEEAFFTEPGQVVGDRSRGRAPSVKEKKRTFDPGRISTPGPSRGARKPEVKVPDTVKKVGGKFQEAQRKSKERARSGFQDKADRKEAKRRLTLWQRTHPGSTSKTLEDFLREVKAERNAK